MESKFQFKTDFLQEGESCFISDEGRNKMKKAYDPEDPYKNVLWTTDYKMELPIKMREEGPNKRKPLTLVSIF